MRQNLSGKLKVPGAFEPVPSINCMSTFFCPQIDLPVLSILFDFQAQDFLNHLNRVNTLEIGEI
jgi:hypothetical protein